jgi:hypothetical protein
MHMYVHYSMVKIMRKRKKRNGPWEPSASIGGRGNEGGEKVS